MAAAVSAFVYVNSEINSSDDLFNANVHALAQQEIDPPGYVDCFMSYTEAIVSPEDKWYLEARICFDCEMVPIERASRPSTCMR